MKLLLESDVLIDHIIRNRPHEDGLQQLLLMSSFGDAELWVGAHTIRDAHIVVADMFDEATARGRLVPLLNELHLCDLGASQIRSSLLDGTRNLDECLAGAIARAIDADAIVTRDLERYADASLRVLTPAQVTQHIKNTRGIVYAEIPLATASD